MVCQIYPSELQFSKTNTSDTKAAFLDFSISKNIVSTKIYDKRDDFDFEIVNFPFIDGDVPHSTSYGVYISQLFAEFHRRYYDLISKFQIRFKSFLRQGLYEPEFYGYFVYKLKKIVGSKKNSTQFIKIISHYKNDWL